MPAPDGADEEWRDIPGFDGRYQASTLGRVRSMLGAGGRPVGHVMSPDASGPRRNSRTTYLKLTLVTPKGKKVRRRVHRLILFTFVGKPPRGENDASHLDNDSWNNRLDNLAWKSHGANVRDGHWTSPADVDALIEALQLEEVPF
jgi:hypothetical protein